MALTEVNSLGIKDLEVKTADIAADAITGAKIADDAIDSEHYTNASIDHAHLANDCVDGDNLADDAVDSEHYTDGSIDHAHLADDCVDGDNIADNSVGLAHMAHGTDGQIITYDASGAPTAVGPGTDGQVLTSTGAGSPPAFETISSSDTLSFRNLVINGDFKCWQRGTSATGQTSGFRIADRWATSMGNLGTWTGERSTDVPADQGFGYSFKLDCTTADASPGSADYLYMHYTGEGQDVQHLKFGGSNAESVTVSFWVKCTKTGNFQVNFVQVESTERILGKTVTISSANTWEKKTLTFAGDTGGAGFTNDYSARWRIEMWLDRGSNYSSGALPTSWETMAAADRGATTTLALGDNTSNDFYITGIQVETGSTATAFEHRSFGEELARCQRYYWRVTGNANDMPGWCHIMWHASASFAHFTCPVPMRDSPSFTQNCTAKIVSADSSDTWTSGMYIDNACTTHDNGGGFMAGTFRKDIAGSSVDHPGTTQITVAGNFEFSSEL